MPDQSSHAKIKSGSLLSVIALALITIFAGLLLYSIPGYRIGTIDEPWIGEQAYNLATDGVVRSTMFTGYADNEIQVYVYHKLLVWIAALLIKLFGLKLWLLRLISIVSCLLLMRMIFLYLRSQNEPKLNFLLTILFLLACPLLFMRIDIFRPELLTTVLGFASFYFITRSIGKGVKVEFVLAGFCAGLAVLAHLNGAIFIVAGVVLLLRRKRFLPATLFAIVAVVISLLYFVDSVGQFGTLVNQFLVSPAHPTRSLNPVVALGNLFEEHKRLFRRPDIIGLSTLYVLSLLYRGLVLKRFWANDTIYAVALMLSLGLINSNKTPTYAILIFPFMALSVATVVVDLLQREGGAVLKPIALALITLYLGYALYANGNTALSKREYVAERHQQVAQTLPPDARVVAPLKFMFNQIDRLDIRAFEAIHLILDELQQPFSIASMERYAASINAKYLLFDCEFENDLGYPVTQAQLDSLTIYTPEAEIAGYRIFVLPDSATQQ